MEKPQRVGRSILARYYRPRRFAYGSKASVPADEVTRWLDSVLDLRVRSIICLLSESQLELYRDAPGGLFTTYRRPGLERGPHSGLGTTRTRRWPKRISTLHGRLFSPCPSQL